MLLVRVLLKLSFIDVLKDSTRVLLYCTLHSIDGTGGLHG
jgi:hypothetical protein